MAGVGVRAGILAPLPCRLFLARAGQDPAVADDVLDARIRGRDQRIGKLLDVDAVGGTWVMSSAVTTPVAPSFTHGLWSDEREAWAASPIVPFERLGAIRFIWERRVSRLFARRQVIAFLSPGACREALIVV